MANIVNDVWIQMLKTLEMGSTFVSPREIATKEILCYQSVVPMREPVITIKQRKLGYRFMAAEAAWILSGDNRTSTIAPYSKEIPTFSDDGVRFFGAYGPRVIDQLSHVVKTLRTDPASRQAVMTIWRANPPETKDVPCTVALQWLIREGKLHCIASMRSSDAWLGWPYDVFNFSMISLAILIEIRDAVSEIQLGNLYLTAGSQHLYARNFDGVNRVLAAADNRILEYHDANLTVLLGAPTYDSLVERLWHHANYQPAGGLIG